MLALRPSGLFGSLSLILAACSGTPSVPPPPDQDQARECSSGGGLDAGPRPDGSTSGPSGCAAGEVCVQGRCYARCSSPADCGPDEVCGASGVCTRGARPDAGRMDAGTPGPCDSVECASPQVCHPQLGECVDCSEDTVGAPPGAPGHCSGLAPICDIANGRCVPAGPSHCAPCISDAECAALDGSFTGECVLRETLGVRERTCFLPCAADGSCPSGLDCATILDLSSDTEVTVCVPPIEMPCTNWLSGTRHTSCLSDTDCAALGATLAVYPDACDGEVIATEDGGVSTPGQCLQPCGETADCAAADSGEQCLGPPLFCRFPPP